MDDVTVPQQRNFSNAKPEMSILSCGRHQNFPLWCGMSFVVCPRVFAPFIKYELCRLGLKGALSRNISISLNSQNIFVSQETCK